MTRAVALLGILLVAVGVGVVSIQRARGQLAVIEACQAASAGDVALALALTEGRTGRDGTGRAAAECRCHALIATGAAEACAELIDPLTAGADAWSPEPQLAAFLIRQRLDAGRIEAAAALARTAGRAHPEDASLFLLALEARGAVEPEAELLRDLAAHIPPRGDAAARMRAALGQRHLLRGDPPAALRALGNEPPPGSQGALSLWFDTKGIAHAMNDDLAGARASYARWERAGGRPAETRARYALALSISGLTDPERDTAVALRAALDDAATLGDPTLEDSLAIRLLFTWVASGRADEALALYDELRERLPLAGVDRGELERARRGGELALTPSGTTGAAGAPRATLRFSLATGAGTLWLSPDAGAEPDADYERHALDASRVLEVESRPAVAPRRWVLRDPGGRALASGAVYARAGQTHEVAIRPGRAAEPTPVGTPVAAPPPTATLARAPADGRRRVALLLLDCGDWALTQYLRARGELPVLDQLLRTGHRAVLDSDPPLTAAALEALVWPDRRSDASLVGTVYRFGVELAGLESVGRNPFELLSWVLPETSDLFATIGSQGRTAANLLLAHGGVRGGRHGEVSGPGNGKRRLALGRALRPLDANERARFPALTGLAAGDAHHVHTIAAELDATEQLLRENELDLLAVRIEPLDLLTHAHFGEAAREGQDDGEGLLYAVYRYLDARIGALHRHLDEDDVLIVMSDHGIRTAMEHDRPAIFVASGGGIATGRAAGRPAIRGVSRVIADLLGVETAWPDTGVVAGAAGPFARSAAARD